MAHMIQKPAPLFTAPAVVDGAISTVSLESYLGKWVVFFFYPKDFTFVCPSEIIAFSDRLADFTAINAIPIAASCDSEFSHLAWVNTPRTEGGLGFMQIPIVSDFTKSIARSYNALLEDGPNTGVPLRALYIIDPRGVLRQVTINDLPVGRNVDETIRLIQAFQFVEEHGEVCPANWKPGDLTIKPDPTASREYFAAAPASAADPEASAAPSALSVLPDAAAVDAFIASGTCVIMFSAGWCRNCRKLMPEVLAQAAAREGVKFAKVDGDASPDLMERFVVTALPTFVMLKDGATVGTYVGSKTDALNAALDSLTA